MKINKKVIFPILLTLIVFLTGYVVYAFKNNQVSLIDTRIDLSKNPSYLFADNFDPNNIAINGVGLNDPIEKIKNDKILQPNEYGWTDEINGVSYRISNNKIVEISLSNNFLRPLGISREELIKIKFGNPNEIKETGQLGDKIKNYYYNKGLIVRWIDLDDNGYILRINIAGK